MENQSSTPGFAREDDGRSVGVAHAGYHIQPSLVLSAYASDDCIDAVRQQLIRRAQGMQSSTSPLLRRSGLEGSVVGMQPSDEYMASATPHPLVSVKSIGLSSPCAQVHTDVADECRVDKNSLEEIASSQVVAAINLSASVDDWSGSQIPSHRAHQQSTTTNPHPLPCTAISAPAAFSLPVLPPTLAFSLPVLPPTLSTPIRTSPAIPSTPSTPAASSPCYPTPVMRDLHAGHTDMPPPFSPLLSPPQVSTICPRVHVGHTATPPPLSPPLSPPPLSSGCPDFRVLSNGNGAAGIVHRQLQFEELDSGLPKTVLESSHVLAAGSGLRVPPVGSTAHPCGNDAPAAVDMDAVLQSNENGEKKQGVGACGIGSGGEGVQGGVHVADDVGVNDAAGKDAGEAPAKKKPAGVRWGEDDTLLLLEIRCKQLAARAEKSEKLGNGKGVGKVWDVVSKEMEAGRWKREAEECKRRWNVVRRWYNKLEDNDKRSGRAKYFRMTPTERIAANLKFNFRRSWYDLLERYYGSGKSKALHPDHVQDPGAEEESSPPVAGQEAVQEGAGEGGAQEAAEQRAAGGDAGPPRGPSASSSSTVTAVTDSTPASTKRRKTVNAREQTMHVLNTAMREQTQAIRDSANEQSRVSNSCTELHCNTLSQLCDRELAGQRQMNELTCTVMRKDITSRERSAEKMCASYTLLAGALRSLRQPRSRRRGGR
ncbi:hypothetical protein CBR_g32214 [Chara braunii]|uniref:Myb/SANT-like DNA-binding domain-containing protein n=1 Tax=Chara braunii TaxID=69332 RepID=A0A388JN38_CHABU|nr:hypothetical protein CBR_g32214 [Chara braunii]|eukprot:GBG59198.1 hypothetical protein CBR_g32214 [Chara braunii]